MQSSVKYVLVGCLLAAATAAQATTLMSAPEGHNAPAAGAHEAPDLHGPQAGFTLSR